MDHSILKEDNRETTNPYHQMSNGPLSFPTYPFESSSLEHSNKLENSDSQLQLHIQLLRSLKKFWSRSQDQLNENFSFNWGTVSIYT